MIRSLSCSAYRDSLGPHPEFGWNVETGDVTHTKRISFIAYLVGVLVKGDQATLAGPNAVGEQGKEAAVGRAGVRLPTQASAWHGLNPLPAPKREHPGFPISLPGCGPEGAGLNSCLVKP